jgi:hypothetical protein
MADTNKPQDTRASAEAAVRRSSEAVQQGGRAAGEA